MRNGVVGGPAVPLLVAQTSQGPQITDIQHVTDRWDKVSVFSPAMNKALGQ